MISDVWIGRGITLVSFLIVVGLVVVFHEFGHFLVAKLAKIPVKVFAVGFGPALLRFTRGQTTYRLNLVPLGGYVHVVGIEPDEVDLPDGFHTKPARVRMAVLLAGGTMNLVLGFLVFWLLGACWGVSGPPSSVIENVVPGKHAAEAGLKPGDRIVGVGGPPPLPIKRTTEVGAIREAIASRGRGVVSLLVERNGRELTFQVLTEPRVELVPKQEAPAGAPVVARLTRLAFEDHWFRLERLELVEVELGQIGVVFKSSYRRLGPWESIRDGLISTIVNTGNVLLGLWATLHGDVPFKKAGYGPLGIAGEVGDAAKVHITNFLHLLALISVNLAVINLLPFPALDGARLAFVSLEVVLGWLRRKPIDPRKEAYVHAAGFLALIVLLLVLTANDLLRLFR